MPSKYKRSRSAASVAARIGPTATPPTAPAPPPMATAPPPFEFGSPEQHESAGTFGAGPSFQGASKLSNDEVLACMMSKMDMFDVRLNGMESMIADCFQSIEIMHESLDSRIDTMQGQYQGIANQLQTVIRLL
ncbi:hypothetical protein JCGZ_16300 [Jatropha curcas]|uniref:Uncharacterized protein n=1 Tax=Jatropha curcas TaxID=180498 RepID=A0A067L7S1_JATCU|nr:hypothetical protein JCGZ_16300 [Jatropha curcas]